MTSPAPADTAPMADAALHIRNFAETVESRLATTTKVATFDTGEVLTNSTGAYPIPRPAGMASFAGTLICPVVLQANATHKPAGAPFADNLYAPVPVRDQTQLMDGWTKMFNAPTGGALAYRYVRLVGICWGPAVVAAERAEISPAAAPGDLFPPGQTAHGIRWPGTSDPQYRTAQAIGTLADDVGASLGGAPIGINFVTWSGNLATSSAGYAQLSFAGQLSKVRGALVLGVDGTGGYRQSRMFMLDFHPSNAPTDLWILVTSNTLSTDAGADYAARVRNAAVGANVLVWGDK